MKEPLGHQLCMGRYRGTDKELNDEFQRDSHLGGFSLLVCYKVRQSRTTGKL